MSHEARIRMKKIANLSESICGSLQYLHQEEEALERAQKNITAEQQRVDEKTQQLQALVGELDPAPEP